MRHDGNTTTDRDAQLVERRRLPSSEVSEVGERDLAPRLRRLIRLVDDGDPIGIDSDRSVEEITDGQRDDHAHSRSWTDDEAREIRQRRIVLPAFGTVTTLRRGYRFQVPSAPSSRVRIADVTGHGNEP